MNPNLKLRKKFFFYYESKFRIKKVNFSYYESKFKIFFFFTMNPNLKYFLFSVGRGGGGGRRG